MRLLMKNNRTLCTLLFLPIGALKKVQWSDVIRNLKHFKHCKKHSHCAENYVLYHKAVIWRNLNLDPQTLEIDVWQWYLVKDLVFDCILIFKKNFDCITFCSWEKNTYYFGQNTYYFFCGHVFTLGSRKAVKPVC